VGLYDEDVEDETAGESGRLRCPHCGEAIWLAADPGGGDEQTVIEDCPVCCRPMTVSWRRLGSRWIGNTGDS